MRARRATPAAWHWARRAAYATAVQCACGAGEAFDVLIIDLIFAVHVHEADGAFHLGDGYKIIYLTYKMSKFGLFHVILLCAYIYRYRCNL